MEKRKIVAIATVVVVVLLAIGFGVFLMAQSGSDESKDTQVEASGAAQLVEPGAYDSETTEAGTIVGVDTDGDGVADKVVGKNSDSTKDANGSAGGSSSSSGSGGSNSGKQEWPGGTPPADDGSATQGVTYSQYHGMSAAEQQAWFESFESVEAFFAWYNYAKAVHDANDDSIILDGSGSIDMGAIAQETKA